MVPRISMSSLTYRTGNRQSGVEQTGVAWTSQKEIGCVTNTVRHMVCADAGFTYALGYPKH